MRFSFAIDRDKKTFIFYYAGEKVEIITLTPCKAFKGVFVGRNWKKKIVNISRKTERVGM